MSYVSGESGFLSTFEAGSGSVGVALESGVLVSSD
jgi:hypothetical protein